MTEDLSFVNSAAWEMILIIFARVYMQRRNTKFDHELAVQYYLSLRGKGQFAVDSYEAEQILQTVTTPHRMPSNRQPSGSPAVNSPSHHHHFHQTESEKRLNLAVGEVARLLKCINMQVRTRGPPRLLICSCRYHILP